jgi:hypothetical protein
MSDSKTGITVEVDAKRKLTAILNIANPGAAILKELERLRKVAKSAKNVLQWNKPGRTMTVALEVAQAIALEQALADLEKEEF